MPFEDLGPLPQGDRQDSLQQLSLTALRTKLPVERFLFRDERVDDKGVDLTLEAKIESGFTNCRAQVQLKSTDDPAANADGSISVSIDTSNLNYLSNATSAIYFLWVESIQEMRYAWARDEWHKLDTNTPGWMDQQTFTVRFRDVLDERALDEIHARIIKEARLHRQIDETLKRSSLSEKVIVSIDPNSLTSTDPKELYRWISESGMTFVAAGFGKQVLDWSDVINPENKREGKIQLIRGYAFLSLGRNHEARGCLSAAAVEMAALLPHHQRLLAELRDMCAYNTGQIDLNEYLKRENRRLEGQTGIEAAEYKLEGLRHERLRERDIKKRATMLVEMKQRVDELDKSDASGARKLHARLLVLSAEGDDITMRFMIRAALCRSRIGMGLDATAMFQAIQVDARREWIEWDTKARLEIDAATEERHPLLLAGAVSTRVTIFVGSLLLTKLHASLTGEKWIPDHEALEKLIEEATIARDIYDQAGSSEGFVRATLLIADLYGMDGRQDDAQKQAQRCIGIADAMDYERLAVRARNVISGRSPFQDSEDEWNRLQSEDEDVLMAERSDSELRLQADFLMESLNLEPDRGRFLQMDLQAMRLFARARVGYCEHLTLIADPMHFENAETRYCSAPIQCCACARYRHQSRTRSPDTGYVIEYFKHRYCDACSDQSPKRPRREGI